MAHAYEVITYVVVVLNPAVVAMVTSKRGGAMTSSYWESTQIHQRAFSDFPTLGFKNIPHFPIKCHQNGKKTVADSPKSI